MLGVGLWRAHALPWWAAAGYYLAAAFGVEATSGIDWIRWIISILVAAVLVMIAATVTGVRRGKLTGRRGKAI